MLLLTVTHTFKLKGPKLGDWSKWTCITLEGCLCSLLASNWEVDTGRSLCSFISSFVECWHQIGKLILVVPHKVSLFSFKDTKLCHNFVYGRHWNKSSSWKAYLACIIWDFWRDCSKSLFRSLIFVFVFICCISCHFLRIYAVASDTHTFKENGPRLADRSKSVCITLRSCFCNSLTANWEVSTARSLYIFINFAQLQKFRPKFVHWRHWNKSSNRKAYLACIYMIIWKIVDKNLFRYFIYVFVSICCISCHF